MSFVSRRIAAPPQCPRLPAKAVFRRDEIGALGAAVDYAQAVRREADALVARAYEKAAALDEQAAHDYAKRLRRADAALLERAVELEKAYRGCRDALSARLESALDAAMEAALRSIAATLPPADRMRAVAEALRRTVGVSSAGCLRVSPEDATALCGAGVALPWEVQADSSLVPGTGRLEVEGGAWEITWESIVRAFLDGS